MPTLLLRQLKNIAWTQRQIGICRSTRYEVGSAKYKVRQAGACRYFLLITNGEPHGSRNFHFVPPTSYFVLLSERQTSICPSPPIRITHQSLISSSIRSFSGKLSSITSRRSRDQVGSSGPRVCRKALQVGTERELQHSRSHASEWHLLHADESLESLT